VFVTEVFNENNKKLSYVVDYPENFDKNKKYPLIFYFHGMGMVRNGIQKVIDCVPIRRERIPESTPFIIVAPYCESFTWIECFETLTEFTDYIIGQDFVDENKVYITGSSMGGYTCWAQAVMYPEKFAAAVICCGGGMYFSSAVARIKLPVWAFHGKLDEVVLPRESEILVERINNSGGNAKLTLVENCGHDVWNVAYENEETYRWLISKNK